jgi:hypothetical protein
MVSHNHERVPGPPVGCDPVLGRRTAPPAPAPPLGCVATTAGLVAVLAAPVVPVAVAIAVCVTVGVCVRTVVVGDDVGVQATRFTVQGVLVAVGVTGVAVLVGVLVDVLVGRATALAVGAALRLRAASPRTMSAVSAAMRAARLRRFMMAPLLVW